MSALEQEQMLDRTQVDLSALVLLDSNQLTNERFLCCERRELGIGVEFLAVEPNAEHLGVLAGLVDRKRLRAHVQKIYSVAEAAEAQTEVARGHVRGKLVLNL